MSNAIKRNGNCKAVRCITNGKFYGSLKEAAADNGVSVPSMSYAISKGTRCNGKHFSLESKTEIVMLKLASRLQDLSDGMETMASKAAAYDRMMAEREAARKAEERRANEIADLENRVARQQELCAKAEERFAVEAGKLHELQSALATLVGNNGKGG